MKKFCLPLLFALAAMAHAQTAVQTVDVKANGTDIRDVIFQMFTQVKKSYVLQPGIHEALNLNLVGVEFDEALQIVCESASLKADLQNGIYYIGKKGSSKKSASGDSVQISEGSEPVKMSLDQSVLNRRISAKLEKTPIKVVLAELAKQTHLQIELDPSVPAYRLDAVLTKLTLRQALDRITKATKLTYELTDHRSILISVGHTTTPSN